MFNPGEAVLGTTTPLYTLVLAGLSTLFRTDDLPQLAWVLNALLDTVGTALVFWIGRRLAGTGKSGAVAALMASLFWAAAPFSVSFAVGGLETSLVVTLLLAAFASYLVGRDRWTAAALAAGTLARPDVLIAAIPVFGVIACRWLLSQRERQTNGRIVGESPSPWQVGAAFVLGLLPWLLWSTSVYGSPLPNSMSAKMLAYSIPREAALVRMLQHFATPFHGHLFLGIPWIGVGLILYPFLYVVGAVYAVRRHSRSLPLFLYPMLYVIVYSVANPLIFRWYLTPPLPFWVLGIALGVKALVTELESALAARNDGNRRARRRIAALSQGVLAGVALVSLANAWTLHPAGGPDRPAPKMAWIGLEELYHKVALDLSPELTQSGGTLAAGDIGTLGWYTGAPILDLVGLVSPQAREYYPLPSAAYTINYAVATDLVLAERPDFLVILEVYGRETLARSTEFRKQYQLWRSYPTDIYGSTSLLVYSLAPPVPGL